MLKKLKDWASKGSSWLIFFVLILLSISFIWHQIISSQSNNIEKISYNDFIALVASDKVDTVFYNTNNEWMTITLFNETTKDFSIEERLNYTEYRPEDKRLVLYPATEDFRHAMLVYDVLLVVTNENTSFMNIITNVMSFMFPIFWIIVLIIMIKNSVLSDTKVDSVIQTSDVKFDDIIGHDEIIDDIKFITKLIQNPKIGDKVGVQIPKGILLSGSPGCGKTLIAKAIAGEAGVPFLYQNASSFVDRFVGMGAKHVRDLFKLAKKCAPCVVFIDEIDAVGLDRDQNKGTSEHDQTIDALLQEMDGFSGREGVFIIAATNRPDSLDKALVRAGRFDRQITISPPRDWRIRKEMFDHYLKKFAVSEDVDTENISKQVSGFTGADIAAVCNEASIVAVMRDKDSIDRECIEEAIDKKIFKGNRSKKAHFEKDREIIAYHEAGHAVMSYLLGESIARASIQSTVSGIGGVVFNGDKEDGMLLTKLEFENKICICFAGRASEELKFKSVTTGASNDIIQATEIMTMYIEQFGFDDNFGLVNMTILNKNRLIADSEITSKISDMSKSLYAKCKNLLEENYNLVEILANKLLEVETLSGPEIDELFVNKTKR